MARKIEVEIVGDSRSLERAFSRSSRSASGFNRDIGRSLRGVLSVSGAFDTLGRSVGFASGAFLGGAGVTLALKTSVDAASNLAEQTNKVNVVFGASARTITEWGKTTATNLGIANDQALEAAGTFGGLFQTVGLLPQKNAALSRSLVTLAADLASFNNADPSETLQAIQSGLIGEAEPLRRFAVRLSEARVQQVALRQTGLKNVKALSEQEKMLARVSIILKDTAIQQGDYGRTADGLANAQRSLSALIRDTAAAVGTALLPSVTDLTIRLRDWLANSENQAKISATVNKVVKVTGQVVHGVALAFKVARVFAEPFIDQMRTMIDLGEKLVKTFRRISESKFFNKLKGIGGNLLPPGLQAAIEELNRRQGGSGKPGTSPIGENALNAGQLALLPTKTGGSGTGRLGLIAKFKKLELALARAALTETERDDREILELEEQNLRNQLERRKLSLKERTLLTNQLAAVLAQSRSIDDAASRKRIDAQEKAAAAAKKARDKERATRKKAHDAMVRAAKEAAVAAKEAARDFRDLIATERDRIGELFTGAFLNPSDAQRKAALGAPTPGANVKNLIADLKSQIQAFKAFQRDLATLARRGAPPQLLAELRQGGLAVAPQVHALAASSAGDFAKFKGLFVQRERSAVQAAKQARPVINLTVIVNKDTGHVSVKTTPHGQKRGRNPGVVITNAGHGLLGH